MGSGESDARLVEETRKLVDRIEKKSVQSTWVRSSEAEPPTFNRVVGISKFPGLTK